MRIYDLSSIKVIDSTKVSSRGEYHITEGLFNC